ncbi:MAG: ABC transporter permease [Chloroflexota bacterium]
MTPFKTVQTAVTGISSNILRAVLTTLGIVIGVASVISMLALGNGARAAVEANFRNLGADMVQISVKERLEQGDFVPVGDPLSYEDGLHMPQTVPMVSRVIMSISGQGKIRRDFQVIDMQIAGTTFDGLETVAAQGDVQPVDWPNDQSLNTEAFIANGRFFTPAEVLSNADVCVLGKKTAESLFGGDNPLEEIVWVNRQKCLVIGVLTELEVTNPALRNQARPNESFYMPISTAIGNLFDEQPSVTIVARVTDESQMSAARQQIVEYLRQRHDVQKDDIGEWEDDFEMTTRQDILGAQQQAARTFAFLLAAMATVSLVVGGIGIMNVMLVSVTERTREIGVRLAVGAQPRDIVNQFLLEAILISGLGGVLGIALGVLSIPFVANLNQGVALLAPDSIPLAFGVSLIIGLLFGLYPAIRASRLDPIEALRYE